MAILEEQLAALESELLAEKELTQEHATQCVLMAEQQKPMDILDQSPSQKRPIIMTKETYCILF